ncbi:YraN family protein [Algihabitans albus]|uniref:YraN family protein n=1 Tax=Algihabitans albus TaxID=2164067 RepID=UPI001ABCE96F|nr:YraN family protein [Algihabitans albus]
MRTLDSRRRAYGAGRKAELLAAWWLRLKGYRILAHGLRLPVGEIDLIARRGSCLAFVEVKRRATSLAALEAVTPRQRRRILRAAEAWLARRPDLAGLDLRFDALLLVPGQRPRHLPDAWRP